MKNLCFIYEFYGNPGRRVCTKIDYIDFRWPISCAWRLSRRRKKNKITIYNITVKKNNNTRIPITRNCSRLRAPFENCLLHKKISIFAPTACCYSSIFSLYPDSYTHVFIYFLIDLHEKKKNLPSRFVRIFKCALLSRPRKKKASTNGW